MKLHPAFISRVERKKKVGGERELMTGVGILSDNDHQIQWDGEISDPEMA